MSDAPQIQIPLNFLYDSICEKFKLGSNADDIRAYLRKSGIDEQTVSALLARYFQELNAAEQDDVLTEARPAAEWYGGSRGDAAAHWVRLKGVLEGKKNWSSEMVASLDEGSTAVVAKLLDPKIAAAGGSGHVKGLVLGYVQSGKTANYSAVIAKAIDAGYRFIVVLAGVHNNLRYQTEARLKEEIVEPNETACITLTRTDKNGDFSKTESTSANKACGQPTGFSMAVIKKNVAVLRSFHSWLSAAKPEYLAKCPMLIIDDESDQASINTSKDPELNPSAINGSIRKIMGLFKVASYAGYTATPFANMLVDAGVDDDLYPRDFFISLRKPPSYTGAEELFGAQDIEDRVAGPGLPIVREVGFDEANHVREISKPKATDDYVMGKGLKRAIDGFVLASACRIARKHWTRHFTMLVHCTQRVAVQQQVHDQVQQYVDDMRFRFRKGDNELRTRLENLWADDYVATTRKVDDEIEIQSFDAIWKNCESVLDQMQLVLENSASEARLSYEEKFWGIVVGGNTLSRGLTLEGLMTSYFVRSSNYYDSLLQMGRWFGYRRGYLDLIRIYMTDDLKERFFHLANVESEIREEIHAMAENGDKPVDVGVRIRTLPGMSVTNAMKMRSAEMTRVSLSCTKVQPTFHNLSVAALHDSARAVQGLLQNIAAYGGNKVDSKFSRYQDSHLFRGVSSEVILQFLDDYEFSSANMKFDATRISEYITQVGESGELDDWSVAFVSKLKATRSVALSPTVKLGLSDRSISDGLLSELDPDARYVSRVSTPIDEFIDMGDLVKNCPTDVDEFANIEGQKHGIGYFRRKYRPKNRGLLLVYAFNPDSQLDERTNSSSPYPLVPLKAPDVVYGICFVFPIQAHVVEGAGLRVRRCYLMHIDSSYIYRGGAYDLEKLFSLAELTNEVKDLQDMVEEHLGSMWSLLQQKAEPSIETGPQCNKPYQYSFHSHCRKDWPKDHISTLPRASEKLVRELTASGITRIRDIPDSFTGLTVTQQTVRECIVNDRAHFEGEMLRELHSLEKPLFFIDFETINPALPLFNETRPFQQLPFQWSAHVLRDKDVAEHFEFLAEAGKDPREQFARTLLEILQEQGPIIVYSAFEKTCLNAIAKDFPDLADAIETVCGRMVDLLALIRKHFYHPDFGGSFSIKKVLPALVPELSYKGLSIGDGATAAMSFAKVISGKTTKGETSAIRKALLEYCKLDTFAMVKVYQRLLDPELTKNLRSAS